MEYHSYELKTRRKLDVTAHRAISVEDILSLDIKKAGRTQKKVKIVPEVKEKLKIVKDIDQTITEDEGNNKLGKIVMKQALREQEIIIRSYPFVQQQLLRLSRSMKISFCYGVFERKKLQL
jgi:hypothetical protein